MHPSYLFNNYKLSDLLETQKQNIRRKISSESNEYLSNVDKEKYLEYIQNEFELNCPNLDEDNICVNQTESKIERYNQTFSKIGYYDGFVVKVNIPFLGDERLLLARPSQYYTSLPQADLIKNNIVLTYGLTIEELSTYDFNQSSKEQIDLIKNFLLFTQNDLSEFNNDIKSIAQEAINYKLEKFNKINAFMDKIPFKIQRNVNQPETFKAPNIVRKVEIVKPKAKTVIPEPTLELKEYDFILKICSDMAIVMERSPKAFSTMDEEAIRTHFLVQLNGHYQGQATGETFNSNGKTDILIRNNNQNLFIAECKFWKGEQQYLKTIDQLLGYVSYRDTKTALFIFVRNKDFTNVLNKIDEASKQHNNFVKIDTAFKSGTNTVFRYIFKNINDEQKHLYLTVLAFQIPTETTQH